MTIKQRYGPLFVWLGFSLLTIYCFAGGPMRFPHVGYPWLYVYLASVHLAIIVGYCVAVRRYRPVHVEVAPEEVNRVVKVLSPFVIAVVLLSFAMNLVSGLSIDAALEDPFRARETWTEGVVGTAMMHAAVTLGAVNCPAIATTMAYWNHVRPVLRIPALLLLASTVAFAIQGAARHGLLAFLVLTFAGAAAAVVGRRMRLRFRTLVISACLVVFVFSVYASFIAKRRHFRAVEDYSTYFMDYAVWPVDSEHYAFGLVPAVVEPAFLSTYFSLGHGYEHLAMALEKDFIGIAFGWGHSQFLIRNLVRITGNEDLYRLSYFERLAIEDGMPRSLWITNYAWIASDVTFPGSVLIMGLLAWIFATAWLDTLRGSSIVAATVVAWMAYTVASTSIIFPPADLGSVISYWGSIVIWGVTRRRQRRRVLAAARRDAALQRRAVEQPHEGSIREDAAL